MMPSSSFLFFFFLVFVFIEYVVSVQYALGCSCASSRDTAIFGSVDQHHHQDPASAVVISRAKYWEEEKQTCTPGRVNVSSITV